MARDGRWGPVVRDAVAILRLDGILRGKGRLLDEEGRLGSRDMRRLDDRRASECGHVLGRRAGGGDLVAGEVVDLRLLLHEEGFELVCR